MASAFRSGKPHCGNPVSTGRVGRVAPRVLAAPELVELADFAGAVAQVVTSTLLDARNRVLVQERCNLTADWTVSGQGWLIQGRAPNSDKSMASVTFQVLEGLERGDVFGDLPTPLTIGREEDNQIRLNDERVSRFHAKIQEDGGRVILTDLESTNGTRVNGHPVKMRVLQIGDQVLIGRCLLLFGSVEEIQEQTGNGSGAVQRSHPDVTVAANASVSRDAGEEPSSAVLGDMFDEAPFPHGPPEPPGGLSPIQAAQVSDMLSYLQSQILRVLLHSQEFVPPQGDEAEPAMLTPKPTWHELQQLEMQLALYLKEVADPSRS